MPGPSLQDLLAHVDDLLHVFEGGATEAGERYMRSGDTGTAVDVAAHATHLASVGAVGANASVSEPPADGLPHSALQAAGFVLSALLELEQSLPAPPLPFGIGMPALCATDVVLALPHGHPHPPSLVPPSVIPIPNASVGVLLPVPFLSCAMQTRVAGLVAARCGDMGLAFGCFGLFPSFEILTGSSSVWIEGARAARVIDPTQHCTLTSRGPMDPPLGPMLGMPTTGFMRVLIGGLQMPSFTNEVVGRLMGFAFRGAASVFRRFTAAAFVRRLISSGVIELSGSPAWRAMVTRDLIEIASSSTGRGVLRELERAAAPIEARAARFGARVPTVEIGPMPSTRTVSAGVEVVGEHNGWCTPRDAQSFLHPVDGSPGLGSTSQIAHSPERWVNHGGGPAVVTSVDATGAATVQHVPPPRGTTSASVLLHELVHATRFARGVGGQAYSSDLAYRALRSGETAVTTWRQAWTNFEEYATVAVDNAFRSESGLPTRASYGPYP